MRLNEINKKEGKKEKRRERERKREDKGSSNWLKTRGEKLTSVNISLKHDIILFEETEYLPDENNIRGCII